MSSYHTDSLSDRQLQTATVMMCNVHVMLKYVACAACNVLEFNAFRQHNSNIANVVNNTTFNCQLAVTCTERALNKLNSMDGHRLPLPRSHGYHWPLPGYIVRFVNGPSSWSPGLVRLLLL